MDNIPEGFKDTTIENMTDEEFSIYSVKKDPGLIHREHGLAEYKYVNGNTVSVIQRCAKFASYSAIAKHQFKEPLKALSVGGHKWEFPAEEVKVLNVVGEHDYPNYNGTGIPEEDETFHVVESVHSLEHMKDIEGSISEMIRVLKIGGYLLIVAPDRIWHRHDMKNHKVGERCYNEFTVDECLRYFLYYIANKKISLVEYTPVENKLDFTLTFIKENK